MATTGNDAPIGRRSAGIDKAASKIPATPDLDDYPDPPSSYPEHLYKPENFPQLHNSLLLDAAKCAPNLPRSPVWVMRQVSHSLLATSHARMHACVQLRFDHLALELSQIY
jgi:hypothetical protein